ncbi:DUF3144 domain-containing protein [Shewanella marina]|uniref:DUF3144 domain-containing protein n=1 Tax=Shewanella marina TaxID=487319 RepID=UPI000472DC16|nr:DUF3144 domain-containing protein [Shewanella marina]
MSDNTTEQQEITIYQLADQFIALANQLVQDQQDVGKVGTALRFAAARFNAFEAAIKSADLNTEKQNAIEWFVAEYKDMLSDNIDDHIKNPPTQTVEEEEVVEIFKG